MRHNELGLREPSIRRALTERKEGHMRRFAIKAAFLASLAIASQLVGMAVAVATKGRTGPGS